MKLSVFRELLQAHTGEPFRLVLPNQKTVPVCFHITEVAHVQKRFIDCGGTFRETETCQLQAWVWEDDDHRLLAGKMAGVLDLATTRGVLPAGRDLDIEIEYEDATLSQYTVADYTASPDGVAFRLAAKHTDCLAKELCCPPTPTPKVLTMTQSAETACCGGATGCC